MFSYIFGYASLVALADDVGAVPGQLRGYRRTWGAAMNNWEGGPNAKHWLDRETGERPHIRVAYLDIEPSEGGTVNGVAIPVDAERLALLDAREINYSRVDVTAEFQGPAAGPVYTYIGLDAARERCRQGIADGNVYVSSHYSAAVRRAFASLYPDALAEFDRTTNSLPFPERDLLQVQGPSR